MEPELYLRCLGQPALFTSSGEPVRFRTKKHLALLVYLAVESGHAHRRDHLAELLWSKASLRDGRHSLATALSVLRSRLGTGILHTTREHVMLVGGGVALDLDRLLAGNVFREHTRSALEVAAFLEGFEISEATDFALWKDRQQARLLPSIKDALVKLIDRCRRTADARQIEVWADRMLALDDLSEEAVRAKMEARAFAGDRLTALRLFEDWKTKLLQEVRAAPSELVEGMAVRLRRRGWERTTSPEIPNVATDQWKGRTFIGRASEYRVLYEAWEGVKASRSTHPLVLGDSGVGKTTLVERLTTAAGLEGAAVSRVQSYDLEREIPYATIGGLVRGLLDRQGVSATPPEALAELSRTIPEVRRRFPSIPPGSDSHGETARLRLTDSFYDMLVAIAEEHPVILVVDDLHLADDASLAVLHRVMRRANGQRIMVVMIARPAELARSHQASRLREAGQALGVRELALAPLNDQESREFLKTLLSPMNAPLAPALSKTLLKASAGFPMVLELLVEDWQVNAGQCLALSLETMTADFGSASPPSLYTEVLERLVRTLDASTCNVLNLAAILGRRLNEVGLYRLVDLSVGQTMTGMSELVRRRVLRDAGGGLEFVNELIRTAAYLGVPSPLRKLLHSRIADRFIDAEVGGEQELGLEIAWHCIRAGRLPEATPHLMRGARQSIRSGAPDIAERALTSALPNLSGPEKAEAYLLLIEVLQEQGRWLDSLDALRSLAEEFGTEGYPQHLAFLTMAKLRLGLSSLGSIADKLEPMLGILQHSDNTRARALVGRTLAYFAGERLQGGGYERILALLGSVNLDKTEPELLGQLALARGLLLFRAGKTQESLLQVNTGIAALESRRIVNVDLAQLYVGLGTIRTRGGHYAEAAEDYVRALELARRLGNDSVVVGTTGNLMLCYCRLGRYSDALTSWASVHELVGPELAEFSEIQIAYCAAFAHALLHRPSEALRSLASLDARMVGPVPPWMRQAWLLWKADILLLCREKAEATAIGTEALALGATVPLSTSFAGPFSRWTVLTAEDRAGEANCAALIRRLVSRLSEYDAIDQAEVLASAVYLNRLLGMDIPEDSEALQMRLRRLPTSIVEQFAAMGILQRTSPPVTASTPSGCVRRL